MRGHSWHQTTATPPVSCGKSVFNSKIFQKSTPHKSFFAEPGLACMALQAIPQGVQENLALRATTGTRAERWPTAQHCISPVKKTSPILACFFALRSDMFAQLDPEIAWLERQFAPLLQRGSEHAEIVNNVRQCDHQKSCPKLRKPMPSMIVAGELRTFMLLFNPFINA